MIFLFRETTVAYFISVFSGAFFVVFSFLPFANRFPQLYLWVIVNTVALVFITNLKLKKINQLLYDCDIQNFLAINQGLAKRRLGKANRAVVSHNLIAAHLMMGDNAEARRLLLFCDVVVKPFPKTQVGAMNKFAYLNNWFVYHYNSDDFPAAAQALEQMENIL